MPTIHILAIEGPLEAHAIRAAAEAWGIVVSVTWVGNSQQIVDFLAQHPPHDLIVISAHGDERGLLLPELGESVRHHYPYHEVIRPDDFAQFLALNQNGVIMTSCCGGQAALAEAFLTHGARWYIGAEGFPKGDAALMFVLTFLYHYGQGQSAEQAHACANEATDVPALFRLFLGS